MVSIALVALGLALGVVGLAISVLPLTLLGALWIVCGLISRAYAARINRIRRNQQDAGAGQLSAAGQVAAPGEAGSGSTLPANNAVTTAGAATGTGAAPNRASMPHPLATMLVLSTTCLVSGLAAIAVGYFQLGFDAVHQQWHWFPLVAGIPPTALALISLGMYGLGSAAKATLGEPPTIPAVIVIEAVRETGVYVNERPRLEFDFAVRPEGGEPYRVTKRATVPFTALGGIGIGHAFHATVVGPSDATDMDIDWSSGFDTAAGASQGSADGFSHGSAGASHGSAQGFSGGAGDDGSGDPATRLRQLDELHHQGLVTDTEYQTQRARIIGSV